MLYVARTTGVCGLTGRSDASLEITSRYASKPLRTSAATLARVRLVHSGVVSRRHGPDGSCNTTPPRHAVRVYTHPPFTRSPPGSCRSRPDTAGAAHRGTRSPAARAAVHGLPRGLLARYWCPALSPKQVFESETAQAADRWRGRLVSIADHARSPQSRRAGHRRPSGSCPISTEWRSPSRGSIFHLGIHDMPAASAAAMLHEFKAFTANPVERELTEEPPRVGDAARVALTVLNHPLGMRISTPDQSRLHSRTSLRPYAQESLHATEINGYRRHADNKSVIQLRTRSGPSPCGRGDRHDDAANVMLDVTSGLDFDEFVQEVQRDGVADTVVVPGSGTHRDARARRRRRRPRRQPRRQPFQRHWTQRVFVVREDGRHQSLAARRRKRRPRPRLRVGGRPERLGSRPPGPPARTRRRKRGDPVSGPPRVASSRLVHGDQWRGPHQPAPGELRQGPRLALPLRPCGVGQPDASAFCNPDPGRTPTRADVLRP